MHLFNNMRIIKGMEILKINDKMVAVSTGEATSVYKGIINLNQSAYTIWTLLEKGMSYEDIANSLSKQYEDLTYSKAYEYVKEFADKLIDKGILIEE